jgi:predicted nucleic acid-binding protein
MNAVDTNVLLYVHDPRDATKQATAANLLQSLTDGVLLWQVTCEYLAASRKLVPFGYILPRPTKTCGIFSAFGLRFYLLGARLIERRHC